MKRHQQLPHNYRFITVSVAFVKEKALKLSRPFKKIWESQDIERRNKFLAYLPFLILIPCILIGILMPQNEFEKIRQQILKNPNNYQTHLALSAVYEKNNDLDMAKKEAETAYYLSPNAGETIIAVNRIRNKIQTPDKLQNETENWKIISEKYPLYRDAYLELAKIYYQLKDFSLARLYLDKAQQVDPNSDTVKKFQDFLKK